MSTIRPRNTCWITSRTDDYDRTGRAIMSISRRRTKCAIVELYDESDKTTVRADSSASRGRADERLADARLLLKPNEDVKLGDVIEVEIRNAPNLKIEVVRIFRRADIAGRIHHIDIEGVKWASA